MNSKTLLAVLVVLVVAAGGYYLFQSKEAGVGGGGAMEEQQVGVAGPQDTQTGVAGPGVSPEAERVIGEWESADDPNFHRTFNSDGTVTDTYEGNASATSTGTWTQVVDVEAEGVELPAVGNATYLKLMLDGEPHYFAISTDTTENRLVLIYLSGRGGVQTFDRVQ